MSKKSEPLHVVELQAENVKRLRTVRIRPDGEALVIVGGRNAQGKSSTLDAIEMALGGGKSVPPDPVRHGARKGSTRVDLGEIIVERTFGPKGSKLTVTSKDGSPIKSPQGLLDNLCAAVTFDPLAFSLMDAKRQDKILKELLGLDFTELDEKRAALYTERTDVNRSVKRLDAQLDARESVPDNTPDQEVSITGLLAEMKAAREQEDKNNDVRQRLQAAEERSVDCAEELENRKQDFKNLQDEILEREAGLRTIHAEQKALEAKAAALVDPDTDAITQRIDSAEEDNTNVRHKQEAKQLETELAKTQKQAEKLSDKIEAIDETKREQLAAAEFPVPGMGFDEAGPTLNGVPLVQASQAEVLRLSVAIGAALNPRVKVMLVRDGSRLDKAGIKLLATLAQETGSQVWLERVSEDGEGCSVVIEDGMVLEQSDGQA